MHNIATPKQEASFSAQETRQYNRLVLVNRRKCHIIKLPLKILIMHIILKFCIASFMRKIHWPYLARDEEKQNHFTGKLPRRTITTDTGSFEKFM